SAEFFADPGPVSARPSGAPGPVFGGAVPVAAAVFAQSGGPRRQVCWRPLGAKKEDDRCRPSDCRCWAEHFRHWLEDLPAGCLHLLEQNCSWTADDCCSPEDYSDCP